MSPQQDCYGAHLAEGIKGCRDPGCGVPLLLSLQLLGSCLLLHPRPPCSSPLILIQQQSLTSLLPAARMTGGDQAPGWQLPCQMQLFQHELSPVELAIWIHGLGCARAW